MNPLTLDPSSPPSPRPRVAGDKNAIQKEVISKILGNIIEATYFIINAASNSGIPVSNLTTNQVEDADGPTGEPVMTLPLYFPRPSAEEVLKRSVTSLVQQRVRRLNKPTKDLLRVAIVSIAFACLGLIYKTSEKNTPFSPALD